MKSIIQILLPDKQIVNTNSETELTLSNLRSIIVAVMTDFVTWLNVQMDERNLSQSELARRANLSHTAISMVISGKNRITFEFCLAIGNALGIPPETVFRIAGLLPPTLNDKKLQEILDTINALNDEERDLVLWFARKRYDKMNNND